MKVTLDTNVLISGTFWTGDSFRILEKIDKGEIELVLSEEIIEEYDRVANSEEIIEKKIEKELSINEAVQRIIKNATIVEPKEKFNIIKDDPDDNKIIECASRGKVNYIVS